MYFMIREDTALGLAQDEKQLPTYAYRITKEGIIEKAGCFRSLGRVELGARLVLLLSDRPTSRLLSLRSYTHHCLGLVFFSSPLAFPGSTSTSNSTRRALAKVARASQVVRASSIPLKRWPFVGKNSSQGTRLRPRNYFVTGSHLAGLSVCTSCTHALAYDSNIDIALTPQHTATNIKSGK
jgi:hypothetical protein